VLRAGGTVAALALGAAVEARVVCCGGVVLHFGVSGENAARDESAAELNAGWLYGLAALVAEQPE